jgi:hypothetical protein
MLMVKQWLIEAGFTGTWKKVPGTPAMCTGGFRVTVGCGSVDGRGSDAGFHP